MTYDWLNRQTSWSDGKSTEKQIYRGAGWKRIETLTIENGKTDSVKYLYDGDNVVCDFDKENKEVAFYVTPFLDQNLSLERKGKTYYYTADGLGSIRTLTDASGEVVNSNDYYAFGSVNKSLSKSKVQNRYTYTGRENSLLASANSPMYYRYRMYGTGVGRFEKRDPITYEDGINIYTYALSQPSNLKDPYGLWVGVDQIITFKEAMKRIQKYDFYQNGLSYYVTSDSKHLLSVGFEFFPGGSSAGSNAFIFTCAYGWIDMGHFFFMAGDANAYGITMAMADAHIVEGVQNVTNLLGKFFGGSGGWGDSAYTPEDIVSNTQGIVFGTNYSRSSGKSLGTEFFEFLMEAGAVDPVNDDIKYTLIKDALDKSSTDSSLSYSSKRIYGFGPNDYNSAMELMKDGVAYRCLCDGDRPKKDLYK